MLNRAAKILAALLPLLAAGCAGAARLEFVPLNYKSIDPPPALPARVDFQQCCWWVDDDGRLGIAMEKKFTPPFHPEFKFELQVSLLLEKPPAGKARNYPIGRRELRARVKFGVWESRFSSLNGIAAVYRESGDRLRGALRIQTSRVSSELLGGWSEPANYLMLGTFTAVPDPARGRQIAALTESQGWDRPPNAPTSAPDIPASSPAEESDEPPPAE
jgi:hypothetical protein